MQCIHLVKVQGIPTNSTGIIVSVGSHIDWLKSNNITRFRYGSWQDLTATFRFERIEDAMAFKLRWCE